MNALTVFFGQHTSGHTPQQLHGRETFKTVLQVSGYQFTDSLTQYFQIKTLGSSEGSNAGQEKVPGLVKDLASSLLTGSLTKGPTRTWHIKFLQH